eukprot:scaffold598_cov318-Pavlova_lutheri.AAC.32
MDPIIGAGGASNPRTRRHEASTIVHGSIRALPQSQRRGDGRCGAVPSCHPRYAHGGVGSDPHAKAKDSTTGRSSTEEGGSGTGLDMRE